MDRFNETVLQIALEKRAALQRNKETYDERRLRFEKQEQTMKHVESDIQAACVRWFRYQHPDKVIFSIPNGGYRNAITAAIMKREGALAGVADLFLMWPAGNFHGLFIEMKTKQGRQSDTQALFMYEAIKAGYSYVICHSFDEFKNEIDKYLGL